MGEMAAGTMGWSGLQTAGLLQSHPSAKARTDGAPGAWVKGKELHALFAEVAC